MKSEERKWCTATIYDEEGNVVRHFESRKVFNVFRLCQMTYGHCIGSDKTEDTTVWVFAKCEGSEICNATLYQVVVKYE